MSPNSPEPPAPSPSSEDLGALESARRHKLARLVQLGLDPFGQRFDGQIPIAQIRGLAKEVQFHAPGAPGIAVPADWNATHQGFGDWLAAQGPGELRGPRVRAAGRIMLLRDAGKLKFLDLQDQTGRVQLFIGQKQVGADGWELAHCCDLGDLIGVEGELKFTKSGELTIFAERLVFLTKSLLPPPSKHHGLADAELKQRMRYVDLLYNPGVRDRFFQRSKIVDSIRRTLSELGFCEVEGPALQAIAGGAAARPFVTHHNALDLELFLRISLELHLKRLLVGGMERVFELGRVFRNEGIDTRHNPEFTMLEVYQAYGDYETMMELTETLIVSAVDALQMGRQLPWGNHTIQFNPPFQRATYDELLREHTGVDSADIVAISRLAQSLGLETAGKHPDVIKSEVFEEQVEGRLHGPIFVLDYPASICPLTKRKKDCPELAERFELFIDGMELANAYTELNDPDLQERLFRTQLAGLPADESMARMDHDFIVALRHGMPPAGGLGIGIDRLVMLLTNAPSIRDVILFPLLRPVSDRTP